MYVSWQRRRTNCHRTWHMSIQWKKNILSHTRRTQDTYEEQVWLSMRFCRLCVVCVEHIRFDVVFGFCIVCHKTAGNFNIFEFFSMEFVFRSLRHFSRHDLLFFHSNEINQREFLQQTVNKITWVKFYLLDIFYRPQIVKLARKFKLSGNSTILLLNAWIFVKRI